MRPALDRWGTEQRIDTMMREGTVGSGRAVAGVIARVTGCRELKKHTQGCRRPKRAVQLAVSTSGLSLRAARSMPSPIRPSSMAPTKAPAGPLLKAPAVAPANMLMTV